MKPTMGSEQLETPALDELRGRDLKRLVVITHKADHQGAPYLVEVFDKGGLVTACQARTPTLAAQGAIRACS